MHYWILRAAAAAGGGGGGVAFDGVASAGCLRSQCLYTFLH
jgi:hypothetical protein